MLAGCQPVSEQGTRAESDRARHWMSSMHTHVTYDTCTLKEERMMLVGERKQNNMSGILVQGCKHRVM